MDKLTDKIAALPPDATYFSLEFFPPKTQQGFANLNARLSRMAHSLRPLFVNVTWGAGGSTSAKSLALAEVTQRELGLTTCLHLTCTNMSRKLIDEALEQAKVLGIRNILALRGDPPRSDEYRDDSLLDAGEDDSNKEFTWAVDLVRYIRKQYGDYFCIGVAGYPEGHSDQSHPEHQSAEHDLPYLVEKTQAGADFIMTQLFYDVEAYHSYEKRLRGHKSGLFKKIPIIPGLMPVQSYQILRRTTKLSHASLPHELLKRFEAVKGDDEAVKRVGLDVLSEIVESMKHSEFTGPRGFHFYTLNLEKVVAQILERNNLIPPSTPTIEVNLHDQAVAVEEADDFVLVEDARKKQNRRKSSMANSDPRNRVIISHTRASSTSSNRQSSVYEAFDDEAGVPKEKINSRANTLAISEGEGALGREATWDEFPNGRWGDARSPAYGQIDGYGVSLHVSVPEARRLWGEPKSIQDISKSFTRHLEGDIDTMPWSEESLQPETLTIKHELLKLINKGWWTVASQPAVNGVRSTDPVFGWGPKNGFVFQKPFVEFFIPNDEWQKLQSTLIEHPQITYFAGNAKNDFASNNAESVNPVTWGTFTGKEIITPTIIEAVSFKAWCEEAFGIWNEWQRVYKSGSESSRLLERIRKDYWLVSVIHHGFLEEGALWSDLLGETTNGA
ncbi:Putative methylenetetrahydrofolate reductase, FAD-linked oxidoreductase [Septoria linicola]|uniref:Methylenetetrahydrofolate reductase, FAD-linked oxidoreductase n=1 Tax=Septoria linicola TaxID=215465 RepID=A0A9Q9EIU8_9PEZI|nr:putative methylenetetrahydrofolate reductase, FAD-linked oxidoreductase [Septoria linicola]USW51437.1 Putative methylenetetrahydrofolate reductase, FAD-linked oxidoreductase [Septoria linicola]